MFSRTDTSLFGRWWWTVDRWMLAALALLILFGGFLVAMASSAVAQRIGLSPFHFVIRHYMILVPSVVLMLAISLLPPRKLVIFSSIMFVISLILLYSTFIVGVEIKGAVRWIRVFGFSLQPSEFVKPAFIILNAWILSQPSSLKSFKGWFATAFLLLIVAGPLSQQPDIGMTTLVSTIWIGQLFIAGLSIYLIFVLMVVGSFGLVSAYYIFPHFTSRIDRFIHPQSGDTYQVERAMDAYQAGGLLGVGPGRGTMKNLIPDAHADFIFAVAGEELGLIWCLVLLGLIVFIVLRGLWRAGQGPTIFVALAASGLVVQFAVQAFVNIGSSLHLLPTKGMTLPFISYGGSSLLAIGIGMGMLLALTRKRLYKP